MVKISECVKDTPNSCEDISNDNEKKLEATNSYRFTFPLNEKYFLFSLIFIIRAVITEVIEGESVVGDSNGVINKEIAAYDFTIGDGKTATKIKIKKDNQENEITVTPSSNKISDIVTAIKV